MSNLALMPEHKADEVREELNRFIDRRGQGAVKEVAEAVGVSRQHLGKFRKGADVEQPLRIAIRTVLDELQNRRSAVAEEVQATYAVPGRRDGRTLPLPSAENMESALRIAKRKRNSSAEEELLSIQKSIFDLTDRAERIAAKFDETIERLGRDR